MKGTPNYSRLCKLLFLILHKGDKILETLKKGGGANKITRILLKETLKIILGYLYCFQTRQTEDQRN